VSLPVPLDSAAARSCVAAALEEDLGARGDVTTRATIVSGRRARARFEAREAMVVAGLPVAAEVFRAIDPGVRFDARVVEGEAVPAGTVIAVAEGGATALLEGERSALNFLQRMSGIATATRAAVDEVAGTGASILDTRKTAPGLRKLDKYAVAVGGGTNHRFGLYDAAMIKDTHLAAAGGLAEAIRACLRAGLPPHAVTAEVRTEGELREAIEAGAGRALLDNMGLQALAACVAIGKGRIVLEASGGLRPGALRAVALTGVDCLSLGYLTHSVRAADLAMDLEAIP